MGHAKQRSDVFLSSVSEGPSEGGRGVPRQGDWGHSSAGSEPRMGEAEAVGSSLGWKAELVGRPQSLAVVTERRLRAGPRGEGAID